MRLTRKKGARITAAALLVGATGTVLGVASGLAASSAAPGNLDPATVTGKAEVGQTLTANTGRWSNDPTSFTYSWRRCDQNGGSCAAIGGADAKEYLLKTVDKDNTLRVLVTARNNDGATNSTSVPTAVVTAAATTTPPATGSGCGQQSTVAIGSLAPPERLTIDQQSIQPGVVGRGTSSLNVRFHVSACSGKPVQGALVYVTATPYNQFTVPPEVQTGSDGWAQLEMRRMRGFPASQAQRLLVMFVRARKAGESLLGGVSTRRLVSFRVDLRQ